MQKAAQKNSSDRPLIIILLSLIPLLFLIRSVILYKVNVPIADEWDLTYTIQKYLSGSLTFHDIWVPHCEHRMLFPKCIILPLAKLTGWNINYELAVNIILALGIFSVISAQIASTGRQVKKPALIWLIPVISVIVFSLSQYENWLWGWQIQTFLCAFGAYTALILVSNPDFRWWRLAAAIIFGVLGTFSYGAALLCWPVGAIILAAVPFKNKRHKFISLAVWLAASVIIFSLYLHDYERPASHASFMAGMGNKRELALYTLKYLGTLISSSSTTGALAAGIFGLTATVAAAWILIKKRLVEYGVLLPYMAISLFTLGNSLLTSLARVGLGSDQATSSRYITLSYPFWINVIVLLSLIAVTGREAQEDGPRPKRRASSYAAAALVLLLLSLVAYDSAACLRHFKICYRRNTIFQAYLICAADNPDAPSNEKLIESFHPRPKQVIECTKILKELNLAFFRNPTPSDPLDEIFNDPAGRQTPAR